MTFTFPREYPNPHYLGGSPTIELDNALGSKIRDAVMLRLNELSETRRPCLEPCLKYLLLGDDFEKEEVTPSKAASNASSDDDDDDQFDASNNLGEPRTSQGVFAPNGTRNYLAPD